MEPEPQHAQVDGPLDPDPAVAAAQQWRADNGFRSDAEWVRHVAANPATTPEANEGYAHPLTDDEFDAGSNERTLERDRIVYDYASARPESFAGWWGDELLATDVLTVAFTSDLEQHKAELARRLGGSLGDVRVVSATRTLAELDALQDRLTTLLLEDQPPDAPIKVSAVGRKEELGRVEVTFPKRAPAIEQEVIEAVGADVVCVELGKIFVPL